MSIDSTLPGFRSLDPQERLDELARKTGLPASELAAISQGNILGIDTANGMIENVIGKFELPYAVAGYFQINGRDVLVPMAVEEPSVVAAASYMAKLVRESGGFQTSSSRSLMRAQIQVLGLSDPYGARLAILQQKDEIISQANSQDAVLTSLGGGCRDIEVHVFPQTPRGPMAVVHLLVDVCDAMGANAVNTMAEFVAPRIEQISGGQVRLRILSNLADLRLARARIQLSPAILGTAGFPGTEVINGILDAYALAAVDPYRATTHNKGIMNGIDPVVIATGNDWRAIEAGAHAYACRNGHYGSLSTWELANNGDLTGTLEMPMAVGLVGGATRTHPLAQLSLKIMGVKTARELAEVIVAVGLAQNLGALRALATEGIQRGHMALHARNIAIGAGARKDEIDWLARQLVAHRDIRADKAMELLAGKRGQLA